MTQVPEDDPRLRFVPIDEAIKPPPGLVEHLANMYWVVHPEKGILYWCPYAKKREPLFPQCNSNKLVSDQLTNRLYPWAEVRFLPSVFRKANPRDY